MTDRLWHKLNTKLFAIVLVLLFLQSCAGSGFHLRESVQLSGDYKKISLQGVSTESDLYAALEQAVTDAAGELVPLDSAASIISIRHLKEGKKIIAYTKNRVAREYLVFLRFDYQIKASGKVLESRLVNLDKTLIYDANFVLGKAEEEHRILQSLREEAARLILLRLQYSKL
ncbi:MAG TPA: hypothetical protein EYG68_01310 [Leucothrix mucor]|nr:hypothetical protein [Leucothrix mucor]